uniref:Uncharacterized protein n=1 Tax=Arcella intermedia TaxID=1963864 RepID=A0A6B2L6M3_9EUKA
MEYISQSGPLPLMRQFDWVQFDFELLKEFHGRVLLKDSSFLELFQTNFPEFFWEKIWKFPTFSSVDKKRIFIDDCIFNLFKFVKTQQNLFEIESRDILKHPKGGTILGVNNNSLQAVFNEIYPELYVLFGSVSSDGYWRNRIAIDKFLLKFFNYIETQQHFNNLSTELISKLPGGSTILKHNNGSIQSFCKITYPELIPQNGKNVTRGYWMDEKNNFEIHKMMKCYEIRSKEDWYKISIDQFYETSGKRVSSKKRITKLLHYWYPDEEWKDTRFSEKINKKSRQRYLGLMLRDIFPTEVIFEEYVCKYLQTTLVFDFYIPGMGLVIEYQGEQHYYDILKWSPLQDQQKRDKGKKELCTSQGLKMIFVPYWWDNSLAELKRILNNELQNNK